MLIISRRKGERIFIGDDVRIEVAEVHRSSVKLAIEAAGRNVVRAEVSERTPGAPPLGVTPRRIWESKQVSVDAMRRRVAELEGAVRRFRDAGLDPHPEWLAELDEHTR